MTRAHQPSPPVPTKRASRAASLNVITFMQGSHYGRNNGANTRRWLGTTGGYLVISSDAAPDFSLLMYDVARVRGKYARRDNRVELICGTRQVQRTHGPGKGCGIVGKAEFHTADPHFDAIKAKFRWARAALVINVGGKAKPQL